MPLALGCPGTAATQGQVGGFQTRRSRAPGLSWMEMIKGLRTSVSAENKTEAYVAVPDLHSLTTAVVAIFSHSVSGRGTGHLQLSLTSPYLENEDSIGLYFQFLPLSFTPTLF